MNFPFLHAGDDETVVFSFRGTSVHAAAAITRRRAARLAKGSSAMPWPLRRRSRRAASAWLARAEPPGAPHASMMGRAAPGPP